MHDTLFQNQNQLGAEELPKHATAIGLNVTSFQECPNSGREGAPIRRNIEEAIKAGVQEHQPSFWAFKTPRGRR
jgi:hypothetical protein